MVMPERDFTATIIEDFRDWQMNTVRLLVARDRHDGFHELLMGDGTWQMVQDGAVSSEPPGVVIPRGSVEALAAAIDRWQGNTSHGATEAKVLREWLMVECGRVDAAFHANVSEGDGHA